MEPEWRPLVVAAHLESTEPGDRFLATVDVQFFDRAPEVLDPLRSDLVVIHTEEQIGRRARVSTMDASTHIGHGDDITLAGWALVEAPTKETFVEPAPPFDVLDSELDEGQFTRYLLLRS
jgi:hypothetical protein